MRQLHVQVPADQAGRVLRLAEEYDAFSPSETSIRRADGEAWAMIFLNLPNRNVGAFVERLDEEVEEGQFVLFPQGTLPIQTPVSDVHGQVRRVTSRSTLEVVLDSLQSVGSWKGMLFYAVFSGVVAAYGVLFDTVFLLTAAMLIAPMGAPVMVCVIGAAIGDWRMVRRGAARFTVAILVLIATAALLGWLYRLDVATTTMEQVSSLSMWIAALAVVGGAAGAQALVQSDRDSLVTGTATGFLVAVSLSPPSAVLGLALVLGRWDYVGLMAFLLALTFLGIIIGGWLSLSSFGIRPGDTTTQRGSRRARTALAAAAFVLAAGLVLWQARQGPRFHKADLSREAVSAVREAAQRLPEVRLVEATAHFTRTEPATVEAQSMLVRVTAARTAGTDDRGALAERVRRAVAAELARTMDGVTAFIDVTVLPGGAGEG